MSSRSIQSANQNSIYKMLKTTAKDIQIQQVND